MSEQSPQFSNVPELNKILTEMAEEEHEEQAAVETDNAPSGHVPRTSKRKDKQVEVSPGILVSQRLIDEAVRQTTSPLLTSDDFVSRAREAEAERRRVLVAKDQAELREDIDKSREVVLAMVNRMREPMKYDEKFVSYDTMPGPLQRVVKAYIEAEEANRNLSEAVAALGKDLQPPVTKPE